MKVNVKSLSHVRLLATPWTAAYQAPPSMGFSKQEYWSGVPLPSPMELITFGNSSSFPSTRASLIAQLVKNPPAVQETQVQFLGQEDPLEKGIGTHSNILAWKIPWTEELGRLQSMGSLRVGHD